MLVNLLLSFVAGLLTTLSPCVLPILPIVVGSAFQGHKWGPLALVLGMSLSFAFLGFFLASFGSVLDAQTVRVVGSSLLLIFGLVLLLPQLAQIFSKLIAPFANAAQSFKTASKGLLGQFLVGTLMGAIWSPCSGPTLGIAIGLAAQADQRFQALIMMFLFGVGASIPVLAVAYGSRKVFNAKREKLISLSSLFKKVFAIILILISLSVLTGLDKWLESNLLNIIPESISDLSISV